VTLYHLLNYGEITEITVEITVTLYHLHRFPHRLMREDKWPRGVELSKYHQVSRVTVVEGVLSLVVDGTEVSR
jgi:hypothetical protein